MTLSHHNKAYSITVHLNQEKRSLKIQFQWKALLLLNYFLKNMSIHVITPHRICLSKALWINSIIIVLSYVLLDKLKYELEYILRAQKHLLTFNTKVKSLQRNLLILSQSFLLKIKTFYYFQNTWTNLLITYWKKNIFITFFPMSSY